jgi:DNA-binding winged helix-turn-helix (wHTH) protein
MAIVFDRFALDAGARELRCDGELVRISPKAFDLLLLLLN